MYGALNENFAYLAGLLDGEGCVTYKQYWDRNEKIDHINIFVGEYKWKS